MTAEQVIGSLVRRLAPRGYAALKDVAELRREVTRLTERCDLLEQRLAETAEEAGRSADNLRSDLARLGEGTGDLSERVERLDDDLTESRRLSRRIAQLTDLTFDRLTEPAGAERLGGGSG